MFRQVGQVATLAALPDKVEPGHVAPRKLITKVYNVLTISQRSRRVEGGVGYGLGGTGFGASQQLTS